jgi:hypothetical protein
MHYQASGYRFRGGIKNKKGYVIVSAIDLPDVVWQVITGKEKASVGS